MKRLFGIIIIMTILVSMTACANSEITEPDIIEHDAVLSSAESSAASSGYISIGEQSEESSVPESSAFESASSKPPESSSAAESSASSSKTESSQKPQSQNDKNSSSSSASQSSKPADESSSAEQKPQNAPAVSGEVRAVWISYLEYQSMLTGKSEKEFKNSIKAMFTNLANDGFNTVYVHARSHSDAYYNSDIFPWSVYCTRTEGQNPGFDPLKIMVKEAHAAGLKIEAWINPYRISGKTDTNKISNGNPAYKWLDTDKVVVVEKTGIFYNPADEDVIDLVVRGVEELVINYAVDGIHFDDYFYPTTEESFDSSYYKSYKSAGGRRTSTPWCCANSK